MQIDRRSILTAAMACITTGTALKSRRGFSQGLVTEGRIPAPQPSQDIVNSIIDSLPSSDYVSTMVALANLGISAPLGPDQRPYNQRWPIHANPLLVRMRHDVGYFREIDDCTSWCGVAVGWCLKRSGRPFPPDCASSQSYLRYGTPAFSPTSGDLAVFTDYGNAARGHVAVFVGWSSKTTIEILGGNQQLSDGTNCSSGVPASVIVRRTASTDSRHSRSDGTIAGRYLNQLIQPPPPSGPPEMSTGPAVF